MKSRKELNKIKRNNAKLYPIYKMFSWDLLFFYSIDFLFYTITKNVTAAEVLVINGLYLLFRILMQLPAVAITDFLGRRKSIILGNIFLIIHTIVLIFTPGVMGIIIADLIFALGFDMKVIAEPSLLYDSVSTKGGEGLYSKIDAKGSSWYYILDGVASLTAGYLFVINNYIPIIICLIFSIIATALSFKFKDVYEVEKNKKNEILEYPKELATAFKDVLKSKRLKALILFQIAFYGIMDITKTYSSDLLVTIGVPEEQFSMIFAILILIGGISISFKSQIEKKYKNRTLAFVSLTFIIETIIIGISAILLKDKIIMPIIILMFAARKVSTSIWYVLENKYLKNFTTNKTRNKITFTYEFIGALFRCIFSILGGILLNVIKVETAFLLVGLFFLALMVVVLDYMRTRIGLKPEEYKKSDINYN